MKVFEFIHSLIANCWILLLLCVSIRIWRTCGVWMEFLRFDRKLKSTISRSSDVQIGRNPDPSNALGEIYRIMLLFSNRSYLELVVPKLDECADSQLSIGAKISPGSDLNISRYSDLESVTRIDQSGYCKNKKKRRGSDRVGGHQNSILQKP